tara:strand:+ start:7224 stop:7889 length:666 start_codon:yes stop_codon:yes gene_type:complete
MANTKIEAIVFDLGGVLIEMVSGWEHAHRLANLREISINSLPANFHQKRKLLADDHQRGAIDLRTWSSEISNASESIYTPENAVDILKTWIIKEFEGVEKIIEHLKSIGIPTMGFSNTNTFHWDLLGIKDNNFSSFPVLELLDEIHGSHQIKQIKPNYESFQAFEEITNLSKKKILFFDNEIENIASARQYGWYARHIHVNKEPADQIKASLIQHRILSRA